MLEQKHATTFKDVPLETLAKLGKISERTNKVIDHVERSLTAGEIHSVLIYATGIENAQIIASLLNLRSIKSAAVFSQSDYRDYYVDRFKSGDLKVLTNVNCLAQGFDAPSVDGIYVARPVYSHNNYQQIIGRGLRGVENGGGESCLIVDIEDTVMNFGGNRVGFRDFEKYWHQGRSQNTAQI